MAIHPQPKPIKRKTVKRKKQTAERSVKQTVREECVERDGHCRFATYRVEVVLIVGPCEGRSEWMHLGDKKRARTRNQAPEIRHTTAGSLMGCERHHDDYDDGRMSVEPTTEHGANGLLRVSRGAESCML